jgi:hypothetical protein
LTRRLRVQRRSSASCASPEQTQRAEARGEEQERSKNVTVCAEHWVMLIACLPMAVAADC